MNNNSPLVSVLIPSYNHENYVQETIKSIINQTYKNIELIVIDDGSKDSTWQKIQEMEEVCKKRFVNVHFETKENEGICKTLNKLLSYAKGDFEYTIASDDLAKPQAIEKEVNFLLENPEYSLCVGNNEIIDSEGKRCYWDKKRNILYDKKKARTKTFVEYLKRHHNYFNDKQFGLYSTIFNSNYIPNGYLIRRTIYDKIGSYPNGQFVEDWWLMLQISKYSKMKYLDEILFSYRWHSSNTVKNNEKMREMGLNTLALEIEIQNKVDKSLINEDALNCIKNGVIYKKIGVPFLFEVVTIKKGMDKIRVVKVFNIEIFRFIAE